ncbi:SDR family oxidoreductase [Pseudonocardia acaciae]|uniref:SDR family oxidoreductase n=1 Tax=Pseudonocardia acaciae TaxID=551276 RepID=UPI00048CF854|nr:SDR family oxidoreductase [Pseudonocardia acaciae]
MADPLHPWDLTGRRVLVTGGGRGIGRAIATRFLASGADVMTCGRTEPDDPPSAGGRTVRFVTADVRDPDQAAALVTATVEAFGGLDVVVNNAGGSPAADAATMSPRFFGAIVSLNLTAAFLVGQAANAVMQRGEGGCIINIGSISAHQPSPGTAAYSAAKAGLLGLTRALALEWAPKVRVNHISAGQVHTDQTDEYYGPDGAEVVGRLRGTIASGRMADPEDIASACLYLASPLAGYVSGADLGVEGGGELPARFLATGRPQPR